MTAEVGSETPRHQLVLVTYCAGTGLQAPAGNVKVRQKQAWAWTPWLAEHCGRRPAGPSSSSAQLRAHACGPRTGPLVQACGPRTWHQVQRRRVVVHVGGPSEPSVSAPSGSGLRAENLRVQHLRVQAFGPRTFGFSTFGCRPSGREPSGSVQHLRVQACGPRTFGVQHFGRKPAGREPSGSEGAGRRAVRTFKRLRAHRVILTAPPGAGLRAENRAQACGPRTIG